MIRPLFLLAPLVLLALAGCETEPVRKMQELFQPGQGQQALATGLKQYENGQYEQSLKSLQGAIQQGLGERDRLTAHKYSAFIHCVSNRERQCREEFRKALAIDPGMDLAPEEAKHPMWGSVFRSVKAGR
jgi:Tfp pilus assembly protein PilF